MKSPEQLIKEANELTRKAQSLRDEANRIAKNPLYHLASYLHTFECHFNHTDGCGWEYENDGDFEKEGSTRNRYYKRAFWLCNNYQFGRSITIHECAKYWIKALSFMEQSKSV